jgi:hypothetical protein
MTNPVIVTINELAFITAPAVVMTTEEAVVGPHTPVSKAVLLFPAVILGVTDEAKKPTG